ncbi:mannose-6-phosphate isomerase, type 1 [Microlunatus sagamiharensis]|uniref:mannose-6-phosphate isomerase n=2 Tax=Microlunatus sagamiharensis TaxID=546874 RepID=A0A1H2LH23_9ACTN|nr:mannose-6-phosphate isomerase, type 1 [Microlunatus sagamiharensis]
MKGVVQPYAWGSKTFLPELLGTEPTDEPQAELWLGAHPSAPATLDGRSIDEVIAADPEGVLGKASVEEFGPRLSYLLKVLAADEPLSLQAHPSRQQAEEGYAREEKAGVARDAKDRLFKDDWPKPELLCALIESEALCGFRSPSTTYALVAQLGAFRTRELLAPLADESVPEPERIEQVFSKVMRLEDPESYVSELRTAANSLDAGSSDADVALLADTVRRLSDPYPADPGVLAALLMNRVKLQPGEAMFLDAGNLHAYLHGAGIEIMANSDNVLRGGLTSKHVDVEELVSILDFRPIADDRIEPEPVSPGVVRYPTPATEFALWRVSPSGSSVDVPATESGRALVMVEGSITLSSEGSEITVERGQAAFVEAATAAAASGDGTGFLAGPGL